VSAGQLLYQAIRLITGQLAMNESHCIGPGHHAVYTTDMMWAPRLYSVADPLRTALCAAVNPPVRLLVYPTWHCNSMMNEANVRLTQKSNRVYTDVVKQRGPSPRQIV